MAGRDVKRERVTRFGEDVEGAGMGREKGKGAVENSAGVFQHSVVHGSGSSSGILDKVRKLDEVAIHDKTSDAPWFVWLGLFVAVVASSSGGVLFSAINAPPILKASWRMWATVVVQLIPFLFQFYSANAALRLKWMQHLGIHAISGIVLAAHFGLWSWSLDGTTLARSLLFVSSHPLLLLLPAICIYLVVGVFFRRFFLTPISPSLPTPFKLPSPKSAAIAPSTHHQPFPPSPAKQSWGDEEEGAGLGREEEVRRGELGTSKHGSRVSSLAHGHLHTPTPPSSPYTSSPHSSTGMGGKEGCSNMSSRLEEMETMDVVYLYRPKKKEDARGRAWGEMEEEEEEEEVEEEGDAEEEGMEGTSVGRGRVGVEESWVEVGVEVGPGDCCTLTPPPRGYRWSCMGLCGLDPNPPTVLEAVGAIVGFLGAATMALMSNVGEWESVGGTLRGDLAAFGGAIAFVIYISFGRRLRQWSPLFLYTFPVNLAGAITASITALLVEPVGLPGAPNAVVGFSPLPAQASLFASSMSLTDWILILLMGLVPGTLGHALTNFSLRYLNPIIISVALLTEPIFGTLLGFAIDRVEPLDQWTGIGGGMLLLGAFAVIIGRKKAFKPQNTFKKDDAQLSSTDPGSKIPRTISPVLPSILHLPASPPRPTEPTSSQQTQAPLHLRRVIVISNSRQWRKLRKEAKHRKHLEETQSVVETVGIGGRRSRKKETGQSSSVGRKEEKGGSERMAQEKRKKKESRGVETQVFEDFDDDDGNGDGSGSGSGDKDTKFISDDEFLEALRATGVGLEAASSASATPPGHRETGRGFWETGSAGRGGRVFSTTRGTVSSPTIYPSPTPLYNSAPASPAPSSPATTSSFPGTRPSSEQVKSFLGVATAEEARREGLPEAIVRQLAKAESRASGSTGSLSTKTKMSAPPGDRQSMFM